MISFFKKKLVYQQHPAACGILVLQPGIELMPPAVEPRSPKHWKARDSPPKNFFKLKYCGGGDLVAKSCLTLAIPWTVACQAPLSMGFSRQECWRGLPFPSPGDHPDPGI